MKRLFSALVLAMAVATPGAQAQQAPEPRKVTVNLQRVPLREAIELMFKGTGVQYSVSPEVANLPVTLNLRDVSFEAALRILLRQAGEGQPGLSMEKTGDIYVIRVRAVEAEPEVFTEKVSVQFRPVAEVRDQLDRLRVPVGVEAIEPLPRDNSLLVRGSKSAIDGLKQLIRIVDVPTRSLSIRVAVTGPGTNGRPLQIASTARTLNSKEVVIDEEMSSGGETARIRVQVRPLVQGDGQVLAETDWDISVPVAGGSKGPIRLVKRLSSSARLQSTRSITVGEVDLASFGGQGTVRLWLRADVLPDQPFGSATTGTGEQIEGFMVLGGKPYVSATWLADAIAGQLRKAAGAGYEIRAGGTTNGSPLPREESPRHAGPHHLALNGRVVSDNLLFTEIDPSGSFRASRYGEPVIPLEDLARLLGGKVRYVSATDTYSMVGGWSLSVFRFPQTTGK